MSEKKGKKPDYSGEEKGRTVMEIRWRDCFKFWLAGFILMWLPIMVLTLLGYAVR